MREELGFFPKPQNSTKEICSYDIPYGLYWCSFFFLFFFTPSKFFCIVWAFQLYSKKILSFQEVKNPGIMEGTSSRWVENYEIKIQLLWGIITEFLSGNLHISCYLFSFKNQFSFYD